MASQFILHEVNQARHVLFLTVNKADMCTSSCTDSGSCSGAMICILVAKYSEVELTRRPRLLAWLGYKFENSSIPAIFLQKSPVINTSQPQVAKFNFTSIEVLLITST